MADIQSLYVECMNCRKTRSCCPGIWKNIRGGIPPRGIRCDGNSIDILVVGKNPGHPLKGERDALRGKSGKSLLNAYRRFQNSRSIGDNREPSTRFHTNLEAYLEYILDCKGKALKQCVASTNLVKCSTKKESGPLAVQMLICTQK